MAGDLLLATPLFTRAQSRAPRREPGGKRAARRRGLDGRAQRAPGRSRRQPGRTHPKLDVWGLRADARSGASAHPRSCFVVYLLCPPRAIYRQNRRGTFCGNVSNSLTINALQPFQTVSHGGSCERLNSSIIKSADSTVLCIVKP